MTIIKRADLGRPLTWDELDDNFQQVDDLTAAASAAVSSASASATAATASATASAASATDAANSAANAAAAIVSAVKSTVTFTTGGTLNSNLDRISDGTYLYYWTGSYPVTVDADSTVEGTGGIGAGFWAVDSDILLRASLAAVDGLKMIGSCASIAELRTTEPVNNGQKIKVTSYYSDWQNESSGLSGGGDFYYDEFDTTSPDDSVLTFVTTGGKRWKRSLVGNRVSLFDAGIKCDGTDESSLFENAITTLSALSTYTVLTGLGHTLTKSTSVTVDLVKIGLEDICIYDPTQTTSSTPYYILELEGTALSDRKHKGRQMVYDRVEISGVAGRGVVSSVLQNVNGLKIAPSVDLSGLVIRNSQIKFVNIAMVFGDNSYLITFDDCKINSVNLPMATTLYTGEQTGNLTNAGENMRYNNGVIADSNMIARFQGFECFWDFIGTSFDYTGGPASVAYKQFANFRQGTKLDFIGCHFESGNSSDNWTDNFIETDVTIAVNVIGGATSLGTGNACPYFFYDTSGTSQLSIDGIRLWGQGVLTWSNRGMTKFYPSISSASTQVRGYLSERSPLLVDPTFSIMSGAVPVDSWQVLGGTRTGAVTSSLLSCTQASVTDSAGVTYSSLQITKLASGTNCILRLYVPCPRTGFSPHGNISIYSASAIDLSSSPCSLSVGFLKTTPVIDSYGKPTDVSALTKVSTDIVSIGTTMTRVNARGVLTYSDTHLGYNFMYMSLNLNNLPVSSVINITNVNLEIPMRG